jgi:hypothetical protein
VRFFSQKFILVPSLAAVLAAMPMPAAAFDPMGFVVNKVMEYIIDEATKPKNPTYHSETPVTNRNIPLNSKAGVLEPPRNGNQLEIDGDDYVLAFNSRIRDEGNRLVRTGMIQQEKRIRYTLNSQEQVDKIWLLAPTEQ